MIDLLEILGWVSWCLFSKIIKRLFYFYFYLHSLFQGLQNVKEWISSCILIYPCLFLFWRFSWCIVFNLWFLSRQFVYLRDNLLSTLEGVEILTRVKVLYNNLRLCYVWIISYRIFTDWLKEAIYFVRFLIWVLMILRGPDLSLLRIAKYCRYVVFFLFYFICGSYYLKAEIRKLKDVNTYLIIAVWNP